MGRLNRKQNDYIFYIFQRKLDLELNFKLSSAEMFTLYARRKPLNSQFTFHEN